MPLSFEQDDTLGYLTLTTGEGSSVRILVNSFYNNSFKGETAETQYERVRGFLEGKPSKRSAWFSNCNGSSWFNINFEKDLFTLEGGEFGPTFGGDVNVKCSYSKNKEVIDRFMRFMLPREEEESKN